jgi:hypothetical protein
MCSANSGVDKAENLPLKKMLMALAARIANNREVAGLHTPIDTMAGRLLGAVLSDYLVARCKGGKPCTGSFPGGKLSLTKDGRLCRQDKDKALTALNETGLELVLVSGDGVCDLVPGEFEIQKSEALAWLWSKAREEWGPAVREMSAVGDTR